jgi:4-hydroxybenzoate polyprenyltransferase
MPNITKRFHKNYDEIEKKRVLQKGYNFRKFAIIFFILGVLIQVIFMRTISIYLMGLLLALCSILFLYGYFLTSLILYKKKNNG